MKTRNCIFLFTVLFISLISFSQDGSPDLSFGDGGSIITDVDGGSDFALSLAEQSDGKIIVVGGTDTNGNHYPTLIRYLNDGSIDTSFGTNGFVWNDYNNSEGNYSSVFIQNDDKIIAGIYLNNDFILTRYLPNGIIDTSFGTNGNLFVFNNSALTGLRGLVFQDESTFLIAGTEFNAVPEIILKRYFLDGSLDTSFGVNGISSTIIGNESNFTKSFGLLNNGDIMVLSEINDNGVTEFGLIRFLSDGTLDVSYGNNGFLVLIVNPGFKANEISVYNDNKIVIKTSYYDYVNEINTTKIFRVFPNGEFDTSFANNGYITIGNSVIVIKKLTVQYNQRLLLYGENTDPFEGGGPTFLKRYYLNGNIDASFAFTPINYELFTSTMIIQNDGKIICAASTPWYNGPEDIVLERYNNNPLSVSENTISNLIVFPNPSNGIFNISHDFIVSETAYQISDITGKIIQQGNLFGEQTQLDISQFENGVYLFTSEGSTVRLLKN